MNRTKYAAARLVARSLGALQSRDEPAHGTRVLMYHDVNDTGTRDDIYSLPVGQFAEGVAALVKWARQYGHSFVPLTATPQPGIAVTFDDGYRSTLTLAAPILAEHSISFSVFVTKSFVDSNSKYLTTTDLQTLASLPGAVLGTHGVSHSQFAELDEKSIARGVVVIARLAATNNWSSSHFVVVSARKPYAAHRRDSPRVRLYDGGLQFAGYVHRRGPVDADTENRHLVARRGIRHHRKNARRLGQTAAVT